MATMQGKLLFTTMAAKLMGGMKKGKDGGGMSAMGFDITPDMMQMMGGFTVIRLTSLMGAANVKLTKEDLLALNAQLNKISKPTKRIVI